MLLSLAPLKNPQKFWIKKTPKDMEPGRLSRWAQRLFPNLSFAQVQKRFALWGYFAGG